MPALGLPELPPEPIDDPPVKAILGELRAEHAFEVPDGYELRSEHEDHRRYTTDDGAWAVLLGDGFVTLEAAAPWATTFAEFRARFEALAATDATVGLRYVNHIERDGDWHEAVNPELLGFLAEHQATLELAVNHWVFKEDDRILALKHGVVRAGPEEALGYLLDLDCVTLEPGPPLPLLDDLHKTLVGVFRWCVATGPSSPR